MFSRQIKQCSNIAKNSFRYFVTGEGPEHGESLKGSKSVLTGERGINKVILVGRVGRTPELRGTESNPVTIFPLATSYSLRTKDGNFVQKTEWHRICVFRQAMQDIVSRNIDKGHKVYVSGSISYTSFVDDKNNVQKITSILADDILLMQRKMTKRSEDTTSDSESESETDEKKKDIIK